MSRRVEARGGRYGGRRRGRGGSVRLGFTLIELLVVIVVIGLLIAAIFLVSGAVMRSQRVKATESLMRNLTLVIEQFATENPLRNVYDRKNAQTFGPFPPYQLARPGDAPWAVWNLVEPAAPLPPHPPAPAPLADRLWRDLGARAGAQSNWVSPGLGGDRDDDIRALYTYLRLYSEEALSQVPATALKALDPANPEYVNPKGTGPAPGQLGSTWVDVLGIYDAWGVPLDYFLYVKLDWGVLPNGNSGWRVTDRVPVLRSRGVSREVAEASGDTNTEWIFSVQFPLPAANHVSNAPGFWRTGIINIGDTRENGWARALGEGDLQVSATKDERSLGYVP